MRKGLINILLFFSVVCSAQVTGRYPFSVTATAAEEDTIVAEDAFTAYNAATINGQGSWVVTVGDVEVEAAPDGDKRIAPDNATAESLAYYNTAVNSNHAVQITVDSTQGGRGLGPAVRVLGDSCYSIYSTTTASYLVRIIDGTEAELTTGTAWAKNDVIQLWAYADTLLIYKNGSLDTSIDSDGKYTITTTINGTRCGVAGYGDGFALTDDWKCWNISW